MKILIVDDHLLVREGLQAILRRAYPDMVFLDAAHAQGMNEQLKLHPDVSLILLDVQLPGANGIDLLPQLKADLPQVPIVMLSGDYDRETVSRAIQRGAAGFLPKNLLDQVLLSAIGLVMVGGIYIPAEVFTRNESPGGTVGSLPRPQAGGSASQGGNGTGHAHGNGNGNGNGQANGTVHALPLTGRQLEVFDYLLEGLSNKQICRQLDLAEATVKIHVRAILRTLQVNSRSEAIVAATRMGIRSRHNEVRSEGTSR